MEFYCVGLSLICLITRSIPNGMEFYFTLPTPPQPMMAVSIPNGMEFYVARPCLIHRGLQGLNSQRDGILLYVAYPAPAYDGSFNSQRDGILPRADNALHRANAVSIPNGMEFYIFIFYPLSFSYVSFNSQRDRILLSPSPSASSYTDCFNSQRDGILLFRRRARTPNTLVSIPKGIDYSPNLY